MNELNDDTRREKCRQSARDCRARKKLRYQYIEEKIDHDIVFIYNLYNKIEKYKNIFKLISDDRDGEGLEKLKTLQ
ncbi:hypothetical protein A3Q56_01156 [Intoshia linei]|uniref:BZIP domain-containing protein n=1 Tax=Intoshia linei TaxID=1819745 RepID=A0A177BA32_9BILA|nr:hypothetical protein A3Q56_01156 [Intoshia linei]